jgi:hypothetical protein
LQDTKLFEMILGIASVELKAEDKRVDLWLAQDPTRWPCPECGAQLAAFAHAEEPACRSAADRDLLPLRRVGSISPLIPDGSKKNSGKVAEYQSA